MKNEIMKRPVDKLKAIISQPTVQTQFQNALGKHSDLFVASLVDVFSDGLMDCDPGTVIQQALKAAVLKLPISKSLGFAYLVPYKNKGKKEAQFQIGYKGLIQLAMRSGQVLNINAGAVYEGEYKSFDKLTGMVDLTGEATSNKVVGYFAYMELINGFKKVSYWTADQVTAHGKKYSKSFNYSSSAWKTDFDSMAIKTVLRFLLGKYAPMSIDFLNSLSMDSSDSADPKPIEIEIDEPAANSPAAAMSLSNNSNSPSISEKPTHSDSAKNAHTQDSSKMEPAEGDQGLWKELDMMWNSELCTAAFDDAISEGKLTKPQILQIISEKDNSKAREAIEIVNSFMG